MDHLNLTNTNFANTSTFGYLAPVNVSWSPFLRFLAEKLMSLCFLLGVPGNLAVIILKPNWENLSEVTQGLMINLAVSDLLSLSTLPFWIYNMRDRWTLGTASCQIVSFVTYCSVQCSLLIVTALSVQRYVQVIHQQSCLRFKRSLPVLLWLTSMVLSIPALVCREAEHLGCDSIYTSEEQQVAVLLTECFVGVGSFTVTACSYIFLKSKLHQGTFFNNPSTSRLLTSIIVTCFVLWMPYVVFNLVTVGGILNENVAIYGFYHFGLNIFSSLLFINSCINPLLYAFALGICRKNVPTTPQNSQQLLMQPNMGNNNSV